MKLSSKQSGSAVDLVVALILLLIMIVIFLRPTPAHSSPYVLDIARAEIGRGETIADNKGPDVWKYTQGRSVAWCAGFVSYVLSKVGIDALDYNLFALDIYNKGKRLGLTSKTPKAGDIAVWRRGKANGHTGIVSSVNADGSFKSIEGNVGEFPAKVKIINHKKAEPNLVGFVRI